MEYDAFEAGLEPGGLRNTNDIGILICYILDKAGKSMLKQDLIEIIISNGMANYFDTSTAVSELIKNGNVLVDDKESELLSLSSQGKMISNQLNSELSLYIRHRAETAAEKLFQQKRLEKENPVIITPAKNGGFDVNMRITDGMRDLMSLTLFVADKRDAEMVKGYFYNDPSKLYSVILAFATGDNGMIESALEELKNDKQ